ncbi:SGNH/GDSL hydrolase family protein [Longispora sp. K20-0274]|uniref:SGNH/GDSL hydrolase family protein n=1 Tax=Longispora sp. K20-0274 TaxID=3088255 RepID=UPI0039999522
MKRIAAIASLAIVGALVAPGAASAGRDPWVTSWGTAVQRPQPGNEWSGNNWSVEGFSNQSVRQVVRVAAGGSRVRIRLSNVYGTSPLRVTGATVARSAGGAAVRPGTQRPLTFGYRPSTTVPAGQQLVSDETYLNTSALDSLTVTLYFAAPTGRATFHEYGLTTSYRAAGDHRWDSDGAAYTDSDSHSYYYLNGVEVAGGPVKAQGTVVALGDSITDGAGSSDGAHRYPDLLADRLVAAGRPLAVSNAGINGNRLLGDSDCFGDGGLTRSGRDALDRPGVRTVLVLEGINDIGMGGLDFGCGAPAPVVGAADLIAGYRALIRAAHARGVRVVGATILPMKGNEFGYDTPANEGVRDAVNDWIRGGGEFDGVVDLDRALADPANPDALLGAYDAGDHIHPNDLGKRVMAEAVDLAVL